MGAHEGASRSSTETLGYDHLWVYDHVETVPRREPTHVFEAFTTLAALAQHTRTIKLGQLVTCAAYRNAGLLAKEAACVDVFSGGRLILGLGAGWYEREYQAYGYPVPERGHAAADPRRDARGHEAAVDRGDRHVPGQAPRVRRRVLRPEADPAAARDLGRRRRREGDAAHRGASTPTRRTGRSASTAFVRKSEVLAQHCDEIGRDFDSIVRTHGPDCRIFDTEADLDAWLDSPGGGALRRGSTPHEEYVRDNFVGTVEQVAEKVQAFVDAGCREFVLWFRDYPSTESLERFAKEVIPHDRWARRETVGGRRRRRGE